MDTLFGLIFKLWVSVTQLLIIWLVIALFIPGLNWFDHVYMLALNLIVYPAGAIFDFFNEYYKSVLETWNPDSNPIEDFANILLYLCGIALALGLPVVFFFGWFIATIIGVGEFIPKSIRDGFHEGWTSEAENNWHLVSGRTTIQDTYDAEVQANAIASALNRHR